jgi:uncharacterized protein
MNRTKLTGALLAALAIILGTLLLDSVLPVLGLAPRIALPDVAQNFITVFLGIFIEAAPFLLLGSIASGLIDVFVTADDIARLFPRNKVGATLVGTFLGILFPVCECGVVPVVRRLYQKGLPISSGIAFLLAAPVINPVVIASTYAAFGLSTIFWARIGFTLLVAFGTGLVFSTQPSFVRVMLPRSLAPMMGGANDEGRATNTKALDIRHSSLGTRLQRAFGIAADDFFDMGRYLVMGGLIATALQTFVPQSALVSIGRNPVSSVLALQLLAFVLSVCSTVDAFLALSFLNTFSAGAIIAFLVFGPMIDIKSLLMFSGVFRKRIVFYLLLLPFLMALVIGVFINLNLNW